MGLLYRPQDGVAADFVPFYWRGDYHLFYLKDYRDEAGHGEGCPWFHLVTRDFVHFEDWGEAIPRGPVGSQDPWIFTGCVIQHEGTFHVFYTGRNRHLAPLGRPEQAIMHATSADLRTWRKDPGLMLFAPEGYEPHDWRDPFVFWNDEAGEFWMLLAAKRLGERARPGVTALAASRDLRQWQVRPPLWAPGLYATHECPDLFRWGDWWYLLFSEFSDAHTTRYRMSRSLGGPWLAPADDALDTRCWYAAKTAGDGQRRFGFGWLPTRQGDRDEGNWQWGGNLVVHEIIQRPDGTLGARMPQAVRDALAREVPLSPAGVLGQWRTDPSCAATDATDRFSAILLGRMPDECMIHARIVVESRTQACGLLLRAGEDLRAFAQVRLEPSRQRIVVDASGRGGRQPNFELERPRTVTPGEAIDLRVVADGSCYVVYANDEVALSWRRYEPEGGQVGLFVAQGKARFTDLTLSVRPASGDS